MSADNENNESVMMLNTQYRMASSICEWPSKYFYGGKLVTAPNLLRTGPCYDYRYIGIHVPPILTSTSRLQHTHPSHITKH